MSAELVLAVRKLGYVEFVADVVSAETLEASVDAPTKFMPEDGVAVPTPSRLLTLSQNKLAVLPKADVPAPNGIRPAVREVSPVPPLATPKVPASVIVPEVVTGLPETVRPVVPPDSATEVTVPVVLDAPIAVLKSAALKDETVLSALNRGKVTALGLVMVNRLLPSVVAPRFVRAAEFVVAPVPPLAIASVPARVTAPEVAAEGVSPVVPVLKDVTPAEIAPIWLMTNAVDAI